MPILRHPSRSDIAAVPVDPLDESGVMPVSRRTTVKITAVRISAAPPPLPSLVVPPPASARQPPPSGAQPPLSGGRPSTVKMSAVRSEEGPPSGRMLDSVDFVDPVRIPLELGASPGAAKAALQRPPTPSTAKTPAVAFSPVGTSNVVRKADSFDPRRPGIFAFAGFGLPPESISGAPAYALRVMMRKHVLRQGLAVARQQRSVDVELYEAALRTADPHAYAKGLLALVLGPALALALVVAAVMLLT